MWYANMFTILECEFRPYHHESRQRCRGKCAPSLYIALSTDAILTLLNTSAAITPNTSTIVSRPNKRVELRMAGWIVCICGWRLSGFFLLCIFKCNYSWMCSAEWIWASRLRRCWLCGRIDIGRGRHPSTDNNW